MSRLEELIQEYCPDGVEYKTIGSVTKSINIGINPRKFFKLNPDNATCFYVTVRELNGLQGVKQYEKTDKILLDAVKIINSRANIEKGDILFSNTGTVGKLALVLDTPANWGVNEGIYVIKPYQEIIDSRYLYYVLSGEDACCQYRRKFTGSTLKHVTQKALGELLIPVPPLPVQQEIVRILDSFTELTAELQAELQARKKQYEYYRDELLTSDDRIPRVKLGDISIEMYRGSGIKRDQVTEIGIPCVRYGEIYTTYDTSFSECVSHTNSEFVSNPKYFEHGDILFAITGESVEDIAKSVAYLGNEKCLAGGDIVVMKHHQNPRYLAHVLNTSIARAQKSKGKVKSKVVHSNVPSIKEIEIPLPSLDVQKRYADVLDNFDEICTDLNIGLPAEIEARQKQYEFYRDSLLTFAETGQMISQTDRQN